MTHCWLENLTIITLSLEDALLIFVTTSVSLCAMDDRAHNCEASWSCLVISLRKAEDTDFTTFEGLLVLQWLLDGARYVSIASLYCFRSISVTAVLFSAIAALYSDLWYVFVGNDMDKLSTIVEMMFISKTMIWDPSRRRTRMTQTIRGRDIASHSRRMWTVWHIMSGRATITPVRLHKVDVIS